MPPGSPLDLARCAPLGSASTDPQGSAEEEHDPQEPARLTYRLHREGGGNMAFGGREVGGASLPPECGLGLTAGIDNCG